MKLIPQNLRRMGYSENCTILTSAVLSFDGSTRVDGRTDRRTGCSIIVRSAYSKHVCVAR